MHARVVYTQVQAGKLDDAIRIYRDSVVPVAEKQKGFKAGYLLTDRATGKGISISLWESEADMKASETSGYLRVTVRSGSAPVSARMRSARSRCRHMQKCRFAAPGAEVDASTARDG